jgi:hypothetical protein
MTAALLMVAAAYFATKQKWLVAWIFFIWGLVSL